MREEQLGRDDGADANLRRFAKRDARCFHWRRLSLMVGGNGFEHPASKREAADEEAD
jgi:hypothetical protein